MSVEAKRPTNDVCVCFALRRAARSATRFYDEWMKASGLKITQFSLLRNIARAGTINVTDLAKRLDLERTAMGRNLDLLERRNLIFNNSLDTDQRTRVVSLTPKGQQALDAAEPIWRRAQAEMKRRLGNDGFASLNAVVDQLQAKK